MNADRLPCWFQADKVYAHQGQWFVGSNDAFHLGPYPRREQAASKSGKVVRQLQKLKTHSQQLKYVRKLMSGEWDEIKTNLELHPQTIRSNNQHQPTYPARRGETPKKWTRTSRYFRVGGAWFFATREGIDVGPFANKKEAIMQSERLIERLIGVATMRQAFRIIYQYKHQAAA